MIKKTVLWILIIACASVIFFFSSQKANDSDKVSSGFIVRIVKILDINKRLSDSDVVKIADSMNSIVRVGAHFSIFGLLCFLVALQFNQYGIVRGRLILYSVTATFLYACSDELHQTFVPGRSAQLSDVITDTFGALCGALVAMIIMQAIKRIRLNRTSENNL